MKIFKFWMPVLIWAGMIFYFSSKPRMDSGLEQLQSGLELDFILRKGFHVFEYLIFTGLLYRAIKGSFILNQNRLLFYSIFFSILYAFLDEYHQTFVPTRTGSIYDVMVDSIGIGCSYVILRYMFYLRGPIGILNSKSKASKG